MRNVQTDTDQRKEKNKVLVKPSIKDRLLTLYHRDKCQTVNHFLKIFLRAREKED